MGTDFLLPWPTDDEVIDLIRSVPCHYTNTYGPLVLGTPITWTSSGGTYVITGTSLSNAAARQGDKSATLVDGTKGLPALLEVVVETKVGSAPTDGTTIDCYVGFSSSATAGTDNCPSVLTGADGSLTGPASVLTQAVFLGSVVMSNTVGTGVQRERFLVAPQDAYMIPVLFNNSGQTMSSTGTDTKITVTPMYQQSS